MAATTNLLKVTQFSKDINMKSKDVLEVLSGKGVTVKSSASLEPAQFELLLNALTTDNQIDNIGDYLDGVTYIPSKKNEKNAAAAKPAQTDAKDAKADAPKAVKAENQDNNIQTEKIEKVENERVEKLFNIIQSHDGEGSVHAVFKETIYYKGFAYVFDENGFVEKTEILQQGEMLEEDKMLKVLEAGEDKTSKEIIIETRKNDAAGTDSGTEKNS